MDKNQVAQALEEVAALLQLKKDASPFEVRAYENAARTISALDDDIERLVKEGRLKGIPGLGPTITRRIEELVTTGRLSFLEELRAATPSIKLELLRIQGLGPRRINAIVDQLHIASLEDLERACKEDRVAALPGFGKKTQEKILQGLAFLAEHGHRYLYPVAEAEGLRMRDALASLPEIVRVQVAGSLRRRRETVKDIDIVASVADNADSATRQRVMNFFTGQPGVRQIISKGETRSSIILASGIQMDLRLVTDRQFPYALHHFTGAKEHHIPLRRRALSMNMTINEYGLFRGKEPDLELIPCKDEVEFYAALGLAYIEPELREDMGEIEAAERGELPTLVEERDLRGVLHVHSTWSDGKNTIRELAEACCERGLSYLGITDHSQSVGYANGLSVENLQRQWEEIDRLNAEFAGRLVILKGTECDILKDGSLDYPDEVLARFDFVIASIHSHFTLSPQEQTERMLRAIANPYVTIIGHPTGRLLLERPGYTLDIEAVIEAAARHGVFIEINASPQRLDLDWRYVRKARDRGILIPIDPDAHSIAGLADMHYGVGIARKGWLSAADVLNTRPVAELQALLQRRKASR
ncbi:MAG: DNA polymerase/3'-5' exonuclease PolX [Thermogemmatispora sp.]|uniref:DNA polymerase/3'-5' exonuclease PolX n=1 Tax=Thermogemmatispora sp. TaxID=1968838 RepID=UPI002620E052|nr:DNA polymerase/3'-5' exonuclease PolX [Thermogemmatispora sp.]MBX5457026.1 DNA polymerase/3'-5' exonuclease PolX [Thermogemmatispora sp.]